MEVHRGQLDQADPYLCLPFRLYLAKHQGHLHQGDPYPNVFIFPQPYMHLEDGVIDHRAHNVTNISVGLCTLMEVYHIYNYDIYIIGEVTNDRIFFTVFTLFQVQNISCVG